MDSQQECLSKMDWFDYLFSFVIIIYYASFGLAAYLLFSSYELVRVFSTWLPVDLWARVVFTVISLIPTSFLIAFILVWPTIWLAKKFEAK